MVSKLCLEFLTSLQTSQTDYAGANHNTNFNMKLWISCETSAGVTKLEFLSGLISFKNWWKKTFYFNEQAELHYDVYCFKYTVN